MATYKDSLGFKNNNWGNIRYNPKIKWQGQTGQNGGFVTFDNPANGLRAVMTIIGNYMKAGKRTVGTIISTYAPPSENDTASYILNVAKGIGVKVDQALQPTEQVMKGLAKAIAAREIGITADETTLSSAFASLGRKSYTTSQAVGGGALLILVLLAFAWWSWKKGLIHA